MKYTKKDIETLAKRIFSWAGRHRLGKDFGIFFNGELMEWCYSSDDHEYHKQVLDNVNPLEYCEWFSEKFIGGMCYDGLMYECINGYTKENAYAKLEEILREYGLYLEHCDSCHAEFVPIDDVDDYEYTGFYKEKPKWLYHTEDAPDQFIRAIMHMQFLLASKVGDKGACTIGEYIEFRYEGKLYRMCMQTPYQGEASWSEPLPLIKQMLERVGATEICVNYGRLD